MREMVGVGGCSMRRCREIAINDGGGDLVHYTLRNAGDSWWLPEARKEVQDSLSLRARISALQSPELWVCGNEVAQGSWYRGLDKFWWLECVRILPTPSSEEQSKEQVTVSLEIYWNSDVHLHTFEGHWDERELRFNPFDTRGKISAQHLLKL